jgi:hypothetical protein
VKRLLQKADVTGKEDETFSIPGEESGQVV